MKKQIAVISCLVLSLASPVLSVAQVGKSTMQGQQARPGASAVEVQIVDPNGQPVRADSLPKDVQANLNRVKRAAESLTSPPGAPDAQRVKITVSCSYPPLRCTITIAF